MDDLDDRDNGFLARWSQRKARVREGQTVPAEPSAPTAAAAAMPVVVVQPPVAAAAPTLAAELHETTPPAAAPPTLHDVALLTRDSDYSRFVAPDVDAGVRNAALRQLFSDPHFNIMDGLDTYIGDYHTPDPLPPGMLRRMVQSDALGLFRAEPGAGSAQAATTESPAPDEDPDLRLQPHDAAGPEGAGPSAGEDAAGQP